MKKRIFMLGIIAMMMFVMTGCTTGSFVVIKGEEDNSSTQMSMTYEQFTGHKETKIKVNEGETVKVTVKFVTESGKLDAYIAKDNNTSNAAYKGNDVKTSDFIVTLNEAGTYTIRVDGDKHSGSYSFVWEK